jgi:LuxR family maltose regulon positive regulatory protein
MVTAGPEFPARLHPDTTDPDRGPISAPPEVPDFAVDRRHLVDRLDAAVAKRLVLVVAPAGYGKSVLLAQWVDAHPSRRVAWLTVEANDDPHRFAHRLCDTLSASDHRSRQRIVDRVAYGGGEMGQPFLSAFLSDARTIPSTVLVLDDFHTMRNERLVAEVASLIDQAPPQLHFIVSARVDPALAQYRLRLEDQVADLRRDDLVLEADDAREVIRRIAERDLAEDQLSLLLERTEGWGAGLQLAALSLRHVVDVDGFIASFAGDDHHVTEYLTEQVLDHQPPEIRAFLLRTSILDRLTASLCNAVTGRRDGQEMLERVERSSLFVTRLDDHRGWFRYHQLFRTLLQHHLRASDYGIATVLCQRAADWYLLHGDVETAIDYLSSCKATDRVLDALDEHGPALYTSGRISAAARWLEELSPPAPPHRVMRGLLGAAVHALAGSSALAASRLAEVSSDPVTSRGEALVADVIRTWSVHDETSPQSVIDAAERALDELDTMDSSPVPSILGMTAPGAIRQSCLVNRGTAEAYLGRSAAARASLGMAQGMPHGLVASDVDSLGTEALLDAWEGRLRSAQQHGARALAVAAQAAMGGHPSTASALLALARVARERDVLDQAASLLDAAATTLQATRPSLLLSVLATEQSLLALARGEPAEGLSLLAHHRAESAPPPPAGVASRRDAATVRLLIAVGDREEARRLVDRTAAVDNVDLLAAVVGSVVECGDLVAARGLVDTWPDHDDPASRIQRVLWMCIVDDLTGAVGNAQRRLATAITVGRREGHVRIFLDAGHHAVRLVRSLYHQEPTPYLRRLVEASRSIRAVGPQPVRQLVEQLSPRERAVLAHLSTRQSNAEVAAELGITTNTLKTHLKHIYRKLGVDRRSTAVGVAERLHLL